SEPPVAGADVAVVGVVADVGDDDVEGGQRPVVDVGAQLAGRMVEGHVVLPARRPVVRADVVGGRVVADGVAAGRVQRAAVRHALGVGPGGAPGAADLAEQVVGRDAVVGRVAVVVNAVGVAGRGPEIVRQRGPADGGVVGRRTALVGQPGGERRRLLVDGLVVGLVLHPDP